MHQLENEGTQLLRGLQSELIAALVHARQPPTMEGLIRVRHGMAAESLLGLYAIAIAGSWEALLRQTYAAAARLIGEDSFRDLARRYVATHPSTSGDLEDYGAGFATFVEHSAAPVPAELADLCRFEWIVNRLRRAAEAVPLDRAQLVAMDAETLAGCRLRLIPRAERFVSAHPVAARWAGEPPCAEPDRLLLVVGDTLKRVPLSSIELAFIEAVQASNTLESALEHLLQLQPSVDLQALLARAISWEALCIAGD
jgi:hypothetical protein